MGRSITEATIENLKDLWEAQRGPCSAGQVRRVTVADAVADTELIMLALPTRLIQQLGLENNPPGTPAVLQDKDG